MPKEFRIPLSEPERVPFFRLFEATNGASWIALAKSSSPRPSRERELAVKAGMSMGYVDRDGKMVVPPKFEEAWDFSNGLAAACADECVYIDRSGAAAITDYHATWPFSDGLAVVGEPQVYIDIKGKVVASYSVEK